MGAKSLFQQTVSYAMDEMFEEILRRISEQAFDALLACGVRDLDGLRHLAAENMRQLGMASSTITELTRIQNELSGHAIVSDGMKSEVTLSDNVVQSVEKNHADSISLKNETPLPDLLLKKLFRRTQNVLAREKITTCEQLLELQEHDLYTLGIGRIRPVTVAEIKLLQKKVATHLLSLSPQALTKQIHTENESSIKPKRYFQWLKRCPKEKTFNKAEPSDWSILSQSLPEIFRVNTPPHLDKDDEQFTISDLGIPTPELNKLRGIALFPEDPANFLFSMSSGYLAFANISEETLLVILSHLLKFTGERNIHTTPVSLLNLSEKTIYADIQISLFKDFRAPAIPNLDIVVKNEGKEESTTWGRVGKLSERYVMERLGFTVLGLKVLANLWQNRNEALKIQNTILSGMTVEAYCGFEQLVDSFTRKVGKDERESAVLKGRLGLLNEGKMTLEALGQHENVSRERIRQIEKQLLSRIKKFKKISLLSYLWVTLDEFLTRNGGVCCVTELANLFRKLWKWQILPSENALASLISMSANFKVVWSPPIRIVKPNHQCVQCSEIGAMLKNALEGQKDGMLSFESSLTIINEYCQRSCCKIYGEIDKFSNGFYFNLDEKMVDVFIEDNAFYTKSSWIHKYGKNRTLLVEEILSNSDKPLHFTEVHAKINAKRANENKIPERNIYAYIERSRDLFLWGPGTFIHKKFISIPKNLILKIEENIYLKIKINNIPYLSVTGVFEEYKSSLLAEKIPSSQALYSCMRISNNKNLNLPDYPYILSRESDGQRLPIPLVLEAFVLEQEGIVTLDQIKLFAIEQLCVNEPVFLTAHLPNIPNLLKINRNEYIHFNEIGIKEDQLAPIIDYLLLMLNKHDHVSAKKLFDDKKITCKMLGISTPILLFSIIKYFYDEKFQMSRFPQIRMSGINDDKNRKNGVSLEIINYIKEKSSLCSFAELHQHFVDELGYAQNNIYSAIHFHKNIIHYSLGVVVHLETLGWTNEKQIALENLALSHLKNRNTTGKIYGIVSSIYNYMHDQLPELSNNIYWSPTLIGELLSSEGRFRIIGIQRNAFVSIPNVWNIDTLGDLLYYILNTEYDGAANIDQFISDMREGGILKKSLTSMMLGEESRIVIHGNVIQLARLN